MAIPLQIVSGQQRLFGAADALQIDDIELRNTGAGNDLTIGGNMTGADGEVILGTVDNDTRIAGDLFVDGSATVASTLNFNGDVNLGDGTGDTINIGGGGTDVVNLNNNMAVGAGVVSIGSGVTDYLDDLWLDIVAGSPADGTNAAVNINAGGAVAGDRLTAGANAIGVGTSALTNSSPGNFDLQTVLEALDAAIGAGGATLQTAYDAGPDITQDATGGIAITRGVGSADTHVLQLTSTQTETNPVLVIDKSPAATAVGDGASITMGANAEGDGVSISHAGTDGTGIDLSVTGAANVLGMAVTMGAATGGNAIDITMTSGAGGLPLRFTDGTENVSFGLASISASQAFTYQTEDNATANANGFQMTIDPGDGGPAGGGSGAGTGGNINVAPGNGGVGGAGAGEFGGSGGASFVTGGTGGAGGGVGSGSGGIAQLQGGVGAAADATFAGNGGLTTVRGGTGGGATAAVSAGQGGITQLDGGTGGLGTATGSAGAGGEVQITGGDGGGDGGGGGAVGGDVSIRGGAGSGGSANGDVTIGAALTAAVSVGSSLNGLTTSFFGAETTPTARARAEVQVLDTDVGTVEAMSLYVVDGDPNTDNDVSAQSGSLALDDTGSLWVNTSGGGVGTTWTELSTGGGAGTLQDAYDNGSTITEDNTEQGIAIDRGTNATDEVLALTDTGNLSFDLLTLNRSPSVSGGGDALAITMGANSSQNAVSVTMEVGATGDAMRINDGTETRRDNLDSLEASQAFTLSTDGNATTNGAGFTVSVTPGAGGAAGGGSSGGAGGGITAFAGTGGAGGAGGGESAGSGGSAFLLGGTGGTGGGTGAGSGGGTQVRGGLGASADATSAGSGGGLTVRGGDGGAGAGTVPGAAGGATFIRSGSGGNGTASAAAGSAGSIQILAGNGGLATGGGGGDGGSVLIDAGNNSAGSGGGVDGSVTIGENFATGLDIGSSSNGLTTTCFADEVVATPRYGLPLLLDTDTGTVEAMGIYIADGDPNGTISAQSGSITLDDTGSIWLNTSAGVGTTWTALATGSSAGTLQDAYDNGSSIGQDNTEQGISIDRGTNATTEVLRLTDSSNLSLDMIEIERSPSLSGGGDAIAIVMGLNSTGGAIDITREAGSTGAGLRISNLAVTSAISIIEDTFTIEVGDFDFDAVQPSSGSNTIGPAYSIVSGAGSDASGGGVAGAFGGVFNAAAGAGGDGSGTDAPGTGGGSTVSGGAGGAGTASEVGATGGAVSLGGGAGGAGAGAGGGPGGLINIAGGPGGSDSTAAVGAGGGAFFSGGTGATGVATVAGTGGATEVSGGQGGNASSTTTDAGGPGGTLTLAGGQGGPGDGNSLPGAGATVTLAGGSGGLDGGAGGAAGGSVAINGGAGTGAAADGDVDIGASNTVNVTITATADITFDANGASSPLTYNQSGDLDLVQVASGDLYDGITSVVGALNAVATRIDVDGAIVVEIAIENGVTVAAGDVIAASATAGRATQMDANANANGDFLGIALNGGTGDAGGTVFVRVAAAGKVTDSGASFSQGALFAPDGTGRPTNTAPASSGDLVFRVGFAYSGTEYVIQAGEGTVL